MASVPDPNLSSGTKITGRTASVPDPNLSSGIKITGRIDLFLVILYLGRSLYSIFSYKNEHTHIHYTHNYTSA